MAGKPWSIDEISAALGNSYEAFSALGYDRTYDAWRLKRADTMAAPALAVQAERDFVVDKRVGSFNWRDANRVIAEMQTLKRAASSSQDEATIRFPGSKPVCIVGLSDTHIGSWATDHGLLEAITDEILQTEGLYVALLGDLQQMSIRLRGVLEVSDNLLPPELQHRYIESWLADIAPKVAWATWDNHSVQREEEASGFSMLAELLKRRVVYHNGIGHPTVEVGEQSYRFAVTHKWRGRSVTNPCHGGVLYLTREGHDREIAMGGDSHVPGLVHFTHGPTPKLALNAGATQLNSGYAKRWFTLTTHPCFPAVVLFPDEHRFTGLWSVGDFLRLTGQPAH